MSDSAPGVERYNPLRKARVKGIDRWVLGPGRHAAWAWAAVLVLGIALLVAGISIVESCYNFVLRTRCSPAQEATSIGLIITAFAQIPIVLGFVITAIVRGIHNHRRSRWELEFHETLDKVEAKAQEVDAGEGTRRLRDLLEATINGDFLGARLLIRGDFTRIVAYLLFGTVAIGAFFSYILYIEEGGEAAFVMFLLALLPGLLGLLLYRVAARKRALAEQAVEEHFNEVRTAIAGTATSVKAPSFAAFTTPRRRATNP